MSDRSPMPKVECAESSPRYGRFTAEPLERAFGITLGNTLRRILLSSLPGAAVTWIRIDGVDHEFSTIPHMKEDTIEFIQNVKAIRLKALSDRPGKLTLEVTGEAIVTAADLKASADYEIVNPELQLATLDSPKAKLSVELNVEQGKGYVPSSRSDGLPVGSIPVDAIFTPIRKVSYKVEPVRVGQESNYEKLTLEVWTDFTISPVEALSKAAELLIEQFSLFKDLVSTSLKTAETQLLRSSLPAEQFSKSITELGFSTRTLNCLRRGGINTLGELLSKTEEDLNQLRHFGQKSREELLTRLNKLGYSLMSSETTEKEEISKPGTILGLEKLKEIGLKGSEEDESASPETPEAKSKSEES